MIVSLNDRLTVSQCVLRCADSVHRPMSVPGLVLVVAKSTTLASESICNYLRCAFDSQYKPSWVNTKLSSELCFCSAAARVCHCDWFHGDRCCGGSSV